MKHSFNLQHTYSSINFRLIIFATFSATTASNAAAIQDAQGLVEVVNNNNSRDFISAVFDKEEKSEKGHSYEQIRSRDLKWSIIDIDTQEYGGAATVKWDCRENRKDTVCVKKSSKNGSPCNYFQHTHGTGSGGECAYNIPNLECGTSYTLRIKKSFVDYKTTVKSNENP